ncbi:MAG TPA: hypothetical protein VMR75_02650 [Candidatus Saccharimonadales bacterium]|nr:hypothetical protein [Candidatus Saccharimonadales bacterium]
MTGALDYTRFFPKKSEAVMIVQYVLFVILLLITLPLALVMIRLLQRTLWGDFIIWLAERSVSNAEKALAKNATDAELEAIEQACQAKVEKAKEINAATVTMLSLGKFTITFARDPEYINPLRQSYWSLQLKLGQPREHTPN